MLFKGIIIPNENACGFVQPAFIQNDQTENELYFCITNSEHKIKEFVLLDREYNNKGDHAFIVATHTDRHHIHNHIIFSAVNLDCDRKFRDFQGSKKALGRLSDLICLENG